MNKPNTMESVQPCSGQYSFKSDLRLNAWLMVAMVVWMAELALHKWHSTWSPLNGGLLALAPLLPGLLYVRSCIRFVRGLDELQRRVQGEAVLFSTLGTAIIGAVINTLHAQGIVWQGLPHGLGLGATFWLMFVLWLVGSAMANRRYR